MSKTNSDRPWFTTGPEALEGLIKSSAVVIGSLYALGLLSSSIRLAQLGVASVEFGKPLYVLTGGWACFPFAISTVAWVTYRQSNILFRSRAKLITDVVLPRRIGGPALAVLAATFVLFVLCIITNVARVYVVFYAIGEMGFGNDFTIHLVLLVLTSVGLIAGVKVLAWQLAKQMHFLTAILAGALFVYAAVYLVVFTTTLYLAIPVQLGGGLARVFDFAFDDPKIKQAIVGGDVTNPHFLTSVLAETGDSYIIPAPEVFGLNGMKRFQEDKVQLESMVPRDEGPWHYNAVFGHTYIILAKKAVTVAAVFEFGVVRTLREPVHPVSPELKRAWKKQAMEQMVTPPATPNESPP